MAGSGLTIDDPLMFISWDTLISYANNQDNIRYFKFDRFNANPYDWEYITIRSQIVGDMIKYVDWDGGYIRNLILDIPYNDETKDRGAAQGYIYDTHSAYAFKSYETTGMHWRNLEVENFYINDPRVALIRGKSVFHNCYFNNVVVSSTLTPTSDYWLVDKGDSACPFGTVPIFSESMIYFHSKNIAPRVPFVQMYSSYLNVDYKWDLDNGDLNSNGVIPRDSDPRIGDYFGGQNSILDGTIDLTKTVGKATQATGNLKLVRDYVAGTGEGNPYETYGVHGICGTYGGGVNNQSLTINLKTVTPNSNKVELGTYMFGNSHLRGSAIEPTIVGTPTELVPVTNNGDGYSGSTTYAYVSTNYTLTKYQLRNPDYLELKEYSFIRDDLTRYQQFWNDYPHEEGMYVLTWLFTPAVDADWVKRQNPCVNNQYPFLPFYSYPQIYLPPNNGKVSQSDYIIVYDMYTAQSAFDNHGLAVLQPTSCRVVEELNGAFNVTLTHPKDEEGKYQYILEMNILKVLGQLFVIQRVEEVTSGNSHYVTCYAEHITYTLDDRWLFPPVTIAGFTGQTLIDSIMSQSYDHGGGWQVQYDFTMTSDVEAPEDFADWNEMQDGATPYELIIGSNGLVARLEGELYRDNFNVSINKRMQNALDNAFELKAGYNLTGIKRTVDLTTFCTYLRCFPVVDGELTGEWWAVAWDPRTLPRAYPREVVRSLNFHYTSEEAAKEGWWGKFVRDGQVAFKQMCQPQVSYEFNLKDLHKNPDYIDFENNYRYKVGDKGHVWDERLKAWVEVEISRTEKNGITGETEKVVIGNTRRFTRPAGYNPVVPSNYDMGTDTELEGVPPLEINSDGAYLSDWTIYGAEGGVGEEVSTECFDYDSWYAEWSQHQRTVQGVTYTAFVGGTIVQAAKGFTFTPTQSTPSTTRYSLSYGADISGVVRAVPIYLEKGKEYTLSWKQSVNSPTSYFQLQIYKNKSDVVWLEKSTNAQRSITFTMPNDADFICLGFKFMDVPSTYSMTISNLSITTTAYEIPVRVHQDAQHEQTIRIPIAEPLDENSSISYSDTNIGIPTYSGENTIYVDTTVQPSNMIVHYTEPIEEEE